MNTKTMSSKEQMATEAYGRWHQGRAADDPSGQSWRSGYMSAVVDGRRTIETSGDAEFERLRKIEAAAVSLDKAVAEFGAKPEYVSEAFQSLSDMLPAEGTPEWCRAKNRGALLNRLLEQRNEAWKELEKLRAPAAETSDELEEAHSRSVQFAKYHAMQGLLMTIMSEPGPYKERAAQILAGTPAAETTRDAQDAARYRAIRAARIGTHGHCEIWNVAYVGEQLDNAIDSQMKASAESAPSPILEQWKERALSAEAIVRQVARDTYGEELTPKEFADRAGYDS